MTRHGDWITTYSGTCFYPLDPRPEEVHVEDIAHALGNVCRYAGHCREFYSVAQHSVIVSGVCPPEHALWGLLHDASEAYLGDLVTPLKRQPEFRIYKEVERRLMEAVCDRFGLPREEPEAVRIADKRVFATEVRELRHGKTTYPMMEPYTHIDIVPWPPDLARRLFMERYNELTLKRSA